MIKKKLMLLSIKIVSLERRVFTPINSRKIKNEEKIYRRTSSVVQNWCKTHSVKQVFSRSGKPTDNCFIVLKELTPSQFKTKLKGMKNFS